MPRSTNDRMEFLQGTLEMLILRTLVFGPRHGYGIAQFIRQTSNDALLAEAGSLYPALQRMLIKGWVKAEWGTTAENRRARYYRLTAAGRRQLEQEISDFERVMAAITRVIQTA